MIYLIACTAKSRPDRYKIGTAESPKRRLRELQGASPYRLHIVCVGPGGREYEQRLHVKYNGRRRQGEWFKFTKEELPEVIRTIKKGDARWLPSPNRQHGPRPSKATAVRDSDLVPYGSQVPHRKYRRSSKYY